MSSLSTARTADPLYLSAYLLMRTLVGLLGVALPLVLIAGDLWVVDGDPSVRGSLSAYYHSGMRDLFVGTLCATGIFLIAYQVFRHRWENLLTTVAGFAAFGVALFPTGLPPERETELTPLQRQLGEGPTMAVHFACAFAFIALLAVICCVFARRDGQRDDREGGRYNEPRWAAFHYGCAAVIALAVVFIVVTKVTHRFDRHSLFVGETVAVFSFGASWLSKGRELRRRWRPLAAPPAPPPAPPPAETVSAEMVSARPGTAADQPRSAGSGRPTYRA